MNTWDKFANEDAEYYILSDKTIDYSTEEGQQFFYSSGRELTETLLARAAPYLTSRKAALEIGCGIGRLSLPHARSFEKISAVDVSPTMLEKLKANAVRNGLTNVSGFLPHEKWDDQRYDYVYSFIVFQHISDYGIIRDYIRRISGAMNKGAIAQLQFDTRPAILSYRIRNIIPDFLLPRDQKKAIRRIRRKSEELRGLFAENNLDIITEVGPDDENHTFLLRKR